MTFATTVIRDGSSVVTPISGYNDLSPDGREGSTAEAGGRLTDKERATVVYQNDEEEKKINNAEG
jgi:hypothetical protein